VKPEAKVGILFIAAVILVGLFAFYVGALNPFSNSNDLWIAYNFAGGIEVGSPVRVMGIKVGKVREIKFDPSYKMPNGEEVKLLVRVSVEKKAWPTVRQNSQFFINLAGVIGEKFVEISPGSTDKPEFANGDTVRGEDPPRIDQLISQSYGLAGKVMQMLQSNEGSITDTIGMMNNLVTNLNALLKQVDKTASNKNTAEIVKNITTITADLAFFTQKLRSDDGQKTLTLVNELIWRLKDLDGPKIREFLQKEGIRAHLF